MVKDGVSETTYSACLTTWVGFNAFVRCRNSSVTNIVLDEKEDDEDEEETHESTELRDNAEGTLAWEQASTTKKGPKKKKKKSEGAF